MPTLDRQTGSRAVGLILGVAGLSAAASSMLITQDTPGLLGACAAALLIGAILWRGTWSGELAGWIGVHIGYVLIAVGNHAMDCEPFTYACYYVCGFVWVGLFHPQWSSLILVPITIVTYVVPLAIDGHSISDQLSLLYTLPAWIAVAEVLAWVVARLRETQRALAASEARARAIVEHAAEAIITIDADGRIDSFNPAATQMFGYTAAEIHGRAFATLIGAGFAVRFAPELEVARGGESLGTSTEIAGVHRDGVEFPIYIALSRAQLAGTWRAMAIVQDITEKQELHRKLVTASRQAGMAEIAINVLHNIGNALNSVKTSAAIVEQWTETTRIRSVPKVLELLPPSPPDARDDRRAKLVPEYVAKLAAALEQERVHVRAEVHTLASHVEQIEQIVRAQQAYARLDVDVREVMRLDELIDDALQIEGAELASDVIAVHRESDAIPALKLDRHKVMQIVVNLIHNARQAVEARIARDGGTGTIRLAATLLDGAQALQLDVTDDGIGIASEHLARLFDHGFTTKRDGLGFALHNCALFARELGGSLAVHSEGPGRGARFRLTLPIA